MKIIAIYELPVGGKDNIIFASNRTNLIGKPADADDLNVIAAGNSFTVVNKAMAKVLRIDLGQ